MGKDDDVTAGRGRKDGGSRREARTAGEAAAPLLRNTALGCAMRLAACKGWWLIQECGQERLAGIADG